MQIRKKKMVIYIAILAVGLLAIFIADFFIKGDIVYIPRDVLDTMQKNEYKDFIDRLTKVSNDRQVPFDDGDYSDALSNMSSQGKITERSNDYYQLLINKVDSK